MKQGVLELKLIDSVYKALPPGTIHQRKDGQYKKISNGVWEKVVQSKQESKPEEQKKKRNYMEDIQTVVDYADNSYKRVNGDLRKDKPLVGAWKSTVEGLDAIIDESPEKPITVYRGAGVTLGKTLFGSVNPKEDDLKSAIGKVFTDKGFISTSKDLNLVKRNFLNTTASEDYRREGTPVLMRITGKSKVLDIEKFLSADEGVDKGEQEILLPRGSKFKITDAKKIGGSQGGRRMFGSGSGHILVEVEVIK